MSDEAPMFKIEVTDKELINLAEVLYSKEYIQWFMSQGNDYRRRLSSDCQIACKILREVVDAFKESEKVK